MGGESVNNVAGGLSKGNAAVVERIDAVRIGRAMYYMSLDCQAWPYRIISGIFRLKDRFAELVHDERLSCRRCWASALPRRCF